MSSPDCNADSPLKQCSRKENCVNPERYGDGWLSATTQHFLWDKRGYFAARCRSCEYERLKQYRENHPDRAKANSERYRKNRPDLVSARNKRYRENNLERVQELCRINMKRYYNRHPEKVRERSRRYARENRPKVRERERKYRQKYPAN